MGDSLGKLTPEQYEIMQVLWDSGENGATVAVIWKKIAAGRNVGRTTILKQVQRLEDRGWLFRRTGEKITHFAAAEDRVTAAEMLAEDFVEDFFDGSVSDLVMSLLGTRKLKAEEVRKLRQIVDEHAGKRAQRRQRS